MAETYTPQPAVDWVGAANAADVLNEVEESEIPQLEVRAPLPWSWQWHQRAAAAASRASGTTPRLAERAPTRCHPSARPPPPLPPPHSLPRAQAGLARLSARGANPEAVASAAAALEAVQREVAALSEAEARGDTEGLEQRMDGVLEQLTAFKETVRGIQE